MHMHRLYLYYCCLYYENANICGEIEIIGARIDVVAMAMDLGKCGHLQCAYMVTRCHRCTAKKTTYF